MIESAREAIRRLRRVFAELDYAQWRRLEIQTGLVPTPETEHAIVRAPIDELNALCEAQDHGRGRLAGPSRRGRDTLGDRPLRGVNGRREARSRPTSA